MNGLKGGARVVGDKQIVVGERKRRGELLSVVAKGGKVAIQVPLIAIAFAVQGANTLRWRRREGDAGRRTAFGLSYE